MFPFDREIPPLAHMPALCQHLRYMDRVARVASKKRPAQVGSSFFQVRVKCAYVLFCC